MIDTESHGPLFRLLSRVVFGIPGRPAAKMASFSHTEYGSGLDMLTAVERSDDPRLRKLYFQHALDELEHSALFRDRARALAPLGTAEALDDAQLVFDRGIRGKTPLYDQMDETNFLAFVWLHEREGARQFEVYADLMSDDAASSAMFQRIFKDERFHITYSRKELDRIEAAGQRREVAAAVRKVRFDRVRQGWLRFARGFAHAMAGLWLSLLYLLLVAPFSLVARLSESRSGGFVEGGPSPREVASMAAEQG